MLKVIQFYSCLFFYAKKNVETIHVFLYFLSYTSCDIAGEVLDLSANGSTCAKIIDMGMNSSRFMRFIFCTCRK